MAKMWYCSSENDQRVIYIAGQNKEVTIGRNADPQSFNFVIPDDPSISRKHAVLTYLDNGLFLQDLGSRYGTFVNNLDEKIESKSMIKLNEEDVVRFGKMNSVFKVHTKSFVTCTSTLKGENLQNLRQCISNLSGTIKGEWDDECKFLTMPAITLTMKVVLALVQGAHIVTVDFWNQCLVSVNGQTVLPDPGNFTPQIIESTLNKESVSFLPDNRRQSLFSGKQVVFFSKRQFDMYKNVLTKASATALLLSESKMTKSALCEDSVIVIQYNLNAASQETQAQRNLIRDITNYLKDKGKRLVTDVEIGLAVLYCSMEKYCNADFNFPSEVIKQTDQNVKPSNVLAQESQESSQSIQCKRENVIIDESLSTTNANLSGNMNSSKRKVHDDSDILENSTKKMTVNHLGSNNGNSSMKRKANENDVDENPSKKFATNLESSDSQDTFNFVNKISTNTSDNLTESSTKRLNLVKPQKRKLDSDDNEDNLFQFVQDKSKLPCNTSKSNIFEKSILKQNIKTEVNCESTYVKQDSTNNDVDVKLLRGRKLEELMQNNEKLLSSGSITNNVVKEELDEKMSDLSLGTTIVTIKKELIVKKEPIHIEEQSGKVRNFKKFKKVWPVKMQVTIVSRSTNSGISMQLSTFNSTENSTQNCANVSEDMI